MFKNVASQKLIVYAFDSTTNLPKTGDAANITAYVSIDYGSVTVLGDTSATEMDATNGKGYYLFDLTQGETNGNTLLFSAKSATANIVVIGAPAAVFTDPPNHSLLSIDSNGRVDVIKVAGTTQTARDIGASVLLSAGSGTGQLDFTSGVVKANATQWVGGTIPAVNVTGVPLVDAKYLLGTIFSTPTVAGIPNVNVKTWNDLATVALPLIPTTAGRTLDVSAGGEAGVDWANVGSPTTTLGLTGTTIATSQVVASVTGAVGSVTGAVGSVTGAVGSVTGNVGGNVVGSVASVTGNVGGNVVGTVDSVVTKTGYALTSAYDFAKGTVAMTESYAANGVAPSAVQAIMGIHQMLTMFAISGTSYTVKKLDNSTTAFVGTLDSSTAPTSLVRT